MKIIAVLFAFGFLQCYASLVTLYAKNLQNLQVARPTFTVTQGATSFTINGTIGGQANFTLPSDDVWTLSIVKSAFVSFESGFNFTNAPASIIIPMTSPLNVSTRYRWMLNWVDSTADYDLQLFTPTSCVANKSSNCGGNFTVSVIPSVGPNYMDMLLDSKYNGFYRFGASFAKYDPRALVQVVTPSGISNYIYQSGAASVATAGFWHIADYLFCSWGSEIKYYNEILTQTFTYPWAYDYCLYQPITITGNVYSNVSNINNVTITFVDTTGAYPNVTVSTGASANAYSADLRTTTYRVLVSQAGYYTYDNTTTFSNASATFDIVLNLIPTTTTTTTSTSTSSTSGTSTSSTSGTSGSTAAGTTTSSSTGAAGTTGTSTSGTTAAGTTTTGTVTTTGDNNSTTTDDGSTSITTGTAQSTTAGESAASTSVASFLLVAVAAIVIVL